MVPPDRSRDGTSPDPFDDHDPDDAFEAFDREHPPLPPIPPLRPTGSWTGSPEDVWTHRPPAATPEPGRRSRGTRAGLGTLTRGFRRTAKVVGLLVLAVGLVTGAGGGWLYAQYRGVCGSPCLDLNRLVAEDPAAATIVTDRHGHELARFFIEDRRVLALAQIPRQLRYAVLATEDARFFHHRGVDVVRVVGAILANVRRGRRAEGFSTITMQLARATYPELLPVTEKSLRRKLTEIRVAREIEAALPKDAILERYLNTVYLGMGAYGVEAAARRYFGKPAKDLSLAESALLAGLPRAPSRDNPFANSRRALARRAVVLGRMVAEGVITPQEARAAQAEPLYLAAPTPGMGAGLGSGMGADGGKGGVAAEGAEPDDLVEALAPIDSTSTEDDSTRVLRVSVADSALRVAGMRGPGGGRAPYFVETIRQELSRVLGPALYRGGYRVETTLDLRAQLLAEAALATQLAAIERGDFGKRVSPRDTLQGAVAVMDVGTGDILALVGGRDFRRHAFNRVTQSVRQPGSAFKPVTLAAAIEAGFRPETAISDDPIAFPLADGSVWSPQNFDPKRAGGTLPLRTAIAQSRNRAAARLAHLVGYDSVIAMGRRLGLTTPLPKVPALALGAAGVKPLELLAAYTPAARPSGSRVVPRWVLSVTDRHGRVVLRTIPDSVPVLRPGDAAIWRSILAGVVDAGTATAVRQAGYRGPAAGKTGTTSDATDVWFVGVTPRLAAFVWFGYDRPQTLLGGSNGTGGRLAAPVWGTLMRALGPDLTGRAWVTGPTDSTATPDSGATAPVAPPKAAEPAEDSVRLCLYRVGRDASSEGTGGGSVGVARLVPCHTLDSLGTGH